MGCFKLGVDRSVSENIIGGSVSWFGGLSFRIVSNGKSRTYGN